MKHDRETEKGVFCGPSEIRKYPIKKKGKTVQTIRRPEKRFSPKSRQRKEREGTLLGPEELLTPGGGVKDPD